ncbi:hypothetical protein Bca52824_022039 [Brassica carinata]|uniref:Uncharacterized protein n=1 Tax=Brassica carinata TaxID=52824 RepID=A0A8X8ATY7_BRACI|nr:hypothetical protein Bca52824_022039 [Brassica carinata]
MIASHLLPHQSPAQAPEASLSQSREQALRLLASALLDSTQAALSQDPKVGTTEADIIVDQVTSQDIVDDPEIGKDEVIDVKDKELNKQKLRRRIDQYKRASYVQKILAIGVAKMIVATNINPIIVTNPVLLLNTGQCYHSLQIRISSGRKL